MPHVTPPIGDEPTNLLWTIIVLSIVNAALLLMNGILLKRKLDNKKKNKNVKTYSSVLLLFLLGAIVAGQLAITIILSVLAVAQVLLAIYLAFGAHKAK